MGVCAKCGGYFSVTKQTVFCPECEKSNVSNYDMPTPQGFGEQKGWICPVCGRGLAPWVDCCPCQINRNITWASGTGSSQLTYDECVEALKGYGKEFKL